MHVITGGAFNGKAAWVEKNYHQQREVSSEQWFNAYEKDPLPYGLTNYQGTIVLQGIEQWVYHWMESKSLDEAREYGCHLLKQWVTWEQLEKENQLVVICTDISKGIVPMDANIRKWRDLTGWFYQDLVKQADQVHFIWYGMSQQIK